jgi:RimJ/RimL family protein N-acetyltransferase
MGTEQAEPISVPIEPFGLPWPPLIRDRSTLRPWGASDHDARALASAWAEPDIARWCKVPADHDEAAAARWIATEGERRDAGLALDLVIAEPGRTEVVLGEVGLVVVEPEKRWAELGFWLFPGARGAGRASSAVTGFADWVLATLTIDRLFARVSAENPAAGRVVERAGFTLAGTLPDETLVWVLDRPDPY